MGQVAAKRITPCPAFYHTATNVFEPFQIRDNVKKRTTGKADGVIFNCMVTLLYILMLLMDMIPIVS